MNCTDINTHCDDYLDGNLSHEQQQAFALHLTKCNQCDKSVNALLQLQAGLKNLTVPGPSAGFEQRVFDEVRRQTTKQPSRHFVSGFASAIAAGLALWFVSTLFIVQQSTEIPTGEMTLALNATQTVRLLFDAPDDIELVTLSIDIPDNFELSGYPGSKELTWETSLKKGENVLALPIMAIDTGKGELIAQLSYGDKVKVFRLILTTADNGRTFYRVQPETAA